MFYSHSKLRRNIGVKIQLTHNLDKNNLLGQKIHSQGSEEKDPSRQKIVNSRRPGCRRFLTQKISSQGFLHHLQSKPPKSLPARSRLLAFHPQFNKRELLCVGGRLSNSLLPEAQKHPVLLSASDTFTRLLFHHYHLELKHGGPTAILSHSGNLYSIIGARKLARSVCSNAPSAGRQQPKLVPS